MSGRSPLIQRALDSIIARVKTPCRALTPERDSVITTARFLGDVESVADRLPDQRYAINLCGNRYFFAVAFAAIIRKGQTNLLPQNHTQATQQQLIEDYPDSYVVHDGLDSLVTGVTSIDVSAETISTKPSRSIPEIPLDQLAAIAFTSGSTGTPKPNLKYWHTFTKSTKINARHMLPDMNKHFSCLATVPGQHMWGLETSILIPLLNDIDICDKKPLFPQDVANQLCELPEPRILITTPVHLRALVQSGVQFPKLARILCATAPLSPAVAQQAEALFGCDLIEVFGCSEVGSMARKRSATQDQWELFTGLNVKNNTVDAQHLPHSVALQDQFEFSSERHFKLAGRNEDLIEVAGKRGSLMELNKVLMDCPGVKDGTVFMPESNQKLTRPAAIISASKELKKSTLQTFFTQHLDPVFTPRPIYFVDAIPREENGKLKRSKVLELFESLQKKT